MVVCPREPPDVKAGQMLLKARSEGERAEATPGQAMTAATARPAHRARRIGWLEAVLSRT